MARPRSASRSTRPIWIGRTGGSEVSGPLFFLGVKRDSECRSITEKKGRHVAAARDYASLSDASVAIGGEDDVPEERGGRQELDGKERAFLIQLRGTDDVDLDLLLGLGIFDDEFGALGQAFGKNNHGAGGTDGVRETVDGFRIASDVSDHGHAQQDALGAAAFFGGGLPVERGRGTLSAPGLA